MVSTGQEVVLSDFTDQGAINQLTSKLLETNLKYQPVPADMNTH